MSSFAALRFGVVSKKAKLLPNATHPGDHLHMMSPGPYSKIEERIRSQWKIQPQELLPANNPESFGKTLLEHLRQLALLPCDLPTARQLILAEINSRVTGARTFNGVHRHPFITTRDVQRALKTFIESTGGIVSFPFIYIVHTHKLLA